MDTHFEFVVYSKISDIEKFRICNEIFVFLYDLSFFYPNFFLWFNGLFSHGYELKKDRKMILCRYTENIIGIIILKKTAEEKKICTLRVEKRFRNNGIATELIKKGIEWLEDEKPLFSFCSSKDQEFSKLLKYFDFGLQEEKFGYYDPFSLEYVYNGSLQKY